MSVEDSLKTFSVAIGRWSIGMSEMNCRCWERMGYSGVVKQEGRREEIRRKTGAHLRIMHHGWSIQSHQFPRHKVPGIAKDSDIFSHVRYGVSSAHQPSQHCIDIEGKVGR